MCLGLLIIEIQACGAGLANNKCSIIIFTMKKWMDTLERMIERI